MCRTEQVPEVTKKSVTSGTCSVRASPRYSAIQRYNSEGH